MSNRIWLPLVLLTTSQFPLIAQTDVMHFRSIVADAPSTNSCTLAKTATALEVRLKELGWKNKGADFPDIDWKTNIAAVVTTSDSYARPQGVNLSRNKVRAIIHLDADADEHNSGVFVFQLGPRFFNVKDCSSQYKSVEVILRSKPEHTEDAETNSGISSSPVSSHSSSDSSQGYSSSSSSSSSPSSSSSSQSSSGSKPPH